MEVALPLIYRVETSRGTGLYRCGLDFTFELQESRHPSPYDDETLRGYWSKLHSTEMLDIYFGFINLEQLKFWIYKKSWRRKIKKAGLVVSVYRARFVRTGDTQAVFRDSTSVKIGELDIMSLDDEFKTCKPHRVVREKDVFF